MRRKIKFLAISVVFAISLVACNKGDSKETTTNVEVQSEISGDETETGYDIERIRKNVVIKGHKMEIPVKLSELNKYFTLKEFDIGDKGDGLVDVFDGEDLIANFDVRNYYKGKENEGEAYYLITENHNCVVDGIIPSITTEKEFIQKYGKPDESVESTTVNNKVYYTYGDIEANSYPEETKLHSLRVTVENGIVTKVILIYGNKN